MKNLSDTLYFQIKVVGDQLPEREYRFHPKRKWRFDLAWPSRLLAVECEGGTWTKGAHTRGKHFESDCEKYAEALCLGWRVLRVTTDQIKNGSALRWIERLLESEDGIQRLRRLVERHG